MFLFDFEIDFETEIETEFETEFENYIEFILHRFFQVFYLILKLRYNLIFNSSETVFFFCLFLTQNLFKNLFLLYKHSKSFLILLILYFYIDYFQNYNNICNTFFDILFFVKKILCF